MLFPHANKKVPSLPNITQKRGKDLLISKLPVLLWMGQTNLTYLHKSRPQNRVKPLYRFLLSAFPPKCPPWLLDIKIYSPHSLDNHSRTSNVILKINRNMSCLPQCINRTLLLQCRSIRHWYFATITAYKAQINYMAITLTPPWPQFNAAEAQANILQYQYNFREPRPCGAIREGTNDLEWYSSPCRGFDPRSRPKRKKFRRSTKSY